MQELHEEIRRVAYELHVTRGGKDGFDLDDWLEAERIVNSRNDTSMPLKKEKSKRTNQKKKGDKR